MPAQPHLTDSTDPLLRQLPRDFMARFNEQAAAARLPTWLIRNPRRYSRSRLAVAEWIRQGWHKLFGDCRVLNEVRYDAVCAAIDSAIEPLEIAWAVQAYADHCKTEKFRLDNRAARRTFESFFAHALEFWIPHGHALREKAKAKCKQEAERRRQHHEETTADGMRDRWDRLSRDQQRDLIGQAVKRLAARNIYPGREDFSNPLIRSKLYQLLQEQAKAEGKAPAAVGQVLGKALEV